MEYEFGVKLCFSFLVIDVLPVKKQMAHSRGAAELSLRVEIAAESSQGMGFTIVA